MGFSVVVLVISLLVTTKFKFSQSQSRNYFTMKPYYLLTTYIFGKIIEHSVAIASKEGQYYEVSATSSFFVLVLELIGCSVITVICLEWLLYAKMVRF